MKPKKLGLAACLILTAWAAVAPAQTHLNQVPTDHVTLMGFYNSKSQWYEFRRVFPDGNTDSSKFVVPGDKFLVLTDFEWINDGNDGNEEYLSVVVHGQWDASSRCISSNISRLGQPGPSLNMTAGFVVDPGGWVTVPLHALQGKPNMGPFLFLRGYLTPLTAD